MNKFKVPIQNALFMYSYIWDKVENKDYINLSSNDDFESSNIFAELYLINIRKIIKKGLYKEYIAQKNELSVVRGKIDINSTIINQSIKSGKVFCDYDELIENNLFNQILKYVAIRLYKSSDISEDNKKKLNKIILYFNQVDLVEIKKSDFKRLNYNKSNIYYLFMMKICELIIDSQMLSESSGKYMFYNLFNSDENMNKVFELFVSKFYEHELPKKYQVKYQFIINWNANGGNMDLLPIMKIDTLISSELETIVLDTKYYKSYFTTNFDKDSFISENMYQVVSYLNNINVSNNLRGVLLYPLPFNLNPINESYNINITSYNNNIANAKIQFITIDLSQNWKKISCDLLEIVDKELAINKKKELNLI